MNDDMKEIQELAESKGYEIVKYSKTDNQSNEEIKGRHTFVFEK